MALDAQFGAQHNTDPLLTSPSNNNKAGDSMTLSPKQTLKRCVVFAAFVCVLVASCELLASHRQQQLPLAAAKHVVDAYKRLSKGKKCYEIQPKLNNNYHRGALEIALICKALALGGIKVEPELQARPNYARALKSVEQGQALMAAESIWSKDINREVLFYSRTVIPRNSFEKGLYVLEQHPALTNSESGADIYHLRGLTVQSWRLDWEALSAITQFPQSTIRYDARLNMLKAQRADFSPMSFSNNEDLHVNIDGNVLRPIDGVKIVLRESRRFVISAKYKNAQTIQKALNKGLTKLEKSGELNHYLRAMKIYNPATASWRILN
ncbi:hypothetical protein [Agaribacterium haliotis]|uniref:hypothetical protein n=1 Tax=Agaribacterium haliotis TaxID=2013869 RepID=UPI000BB56FEC|nr:hypothetical protein [Agaribacterium haliotis]